MKHSLRKTEAELERELSKEARAAETGLLNLVETKVKAASTAAAVTGLAVNLLSKYVVHASLPDWSTAIVSAAVVGALSFLAGWLAKHTPRTQGKGT
jgi:hypothetical protein